jgi:hypothetical protein
MVFSIGFIPSTYEGELPLRNYNNIHEAFYIIFFQLDLQPFEMLIFFSIGFLPTTYEDELPLTNYNNIHEAIYIFIFPLEFQ